MDWKEAVRQYVDEKDWIRAWTVPASRLDAMFSAITNPRKRFGRALAVYIIHRLKKDFSLGDYSVWYTSIRVLRDLVRNRLPENIYTELHSISITELLSYVISRLYYDSPIIREMKTTLEGALEGNTVSVTDNSNVPEENVVQEQPQSTYKGFFTPVSNEELEDEEIEIVEDMDIAEAYTDDEIDDFIGKTFNLQKIENIYRRKKYDTPQLFAHTKCVKCGREKRVFLSNLVNDPKKYGSCICSDTNLNSRIDNAAKLYSNKKKLPTNTSGYTGVSFIKNYGSAPYNKWRAYIEVDGVRTYLGDFDTKKEAIQARKEAGEKGIKWYKENRSKLVKNVRKRTKKYQTSKYRDTLEKTKVNHKK